MFLQLSLCPIADLIGSSSILAEARLANDRHPHIARDLLKLLCEVPQRVFPHRPAGGKAGDGPLLDVHPREELLAPHVPNALVWQSLLLSSSTVLQFWRGQHPATDLHQVPRDVQTKLLDERVVVQVGLAHQVVDLPLPVWSGSGRGLDHR